MKIGHDDRDHGFSIDKSSVAVDDIELSAEARGMGGVVVRGEERLTSDAAR